MKLSFNILFLIRKRTKKIHQIQCFVIVVDDEDDADCSTVVLVPPTLTVAPSTWVDPAAVARVVMTVVAVDVNNRLVSSAPKLK